MTVTDRPRPERALHAGMRGERGSAAIEAVIIVPVMIPLLLLVIAGGQIALAHQTVQAIAADTARTASLQRTAPAAQKAALATAHHALDQQVACTDRDIALDLKGFATLVGTPASVTATVTCRVETLGLPGLPSVTVSATMGHRSTPTAGGNHDHPTDQASADALDVAAGTAP